LFFVREAGEVKGLGVLEFCVWRCLSSLSFTEVYCGGMRRETMGGADVRFAQPSRVIGGVQMPVLAHQATRFLCNFT
jgi:hypothetical protein